MSTLQRDARWVAQKLLAGAPVKVGEPDLADLARSMRSSVLEPGEVLYGAADAVPGVWIVRSGQVEISRGTGRDRCVVAIQREGDVIGDAYLLLQSAPPFTARCTEATSCWFIAATDFRRLMASYPSIAIAWACNLAYRLCQSRDRILNCVNGTLSQRLARLLLSEVEDHAIRLPQKTIAQMLGVQRTSVNKLLKEFERRGLVQVRYGAVVVRDEQALSAVAGGPERSSESSAIPSEFFGAATSFTWFSIATGLSTAM